jgi:ADP-ribosylation factor GTPase-activating protein 1
MEGGSDVSMQEAENFF